MATKVEAAHLMMVNAARLKDAGERNDVEAGMAKLLASEYCAEVTQESFRIHGGYGYSKEYEIERLMREAPFLLIGEGTSEIQKTIISRGLLQGVPRGAVAINVGTSTTRRAGARSVNTRMHELRCTPRPQLFTASKSPICRASRSCGKRGLKSTRAVVAAERRSRA